MSRSLLAHAALIRRYHVLDVDEGVLAAVDFKHLQSLLNQITQNHALALAVVNVVANVDAALLKEVHDWQELAEVGHQSLTHGIVAHNQCLQYFQRDGHDLRITRVQRS